MSKLKAALCILATLVGPTLISMLLISIYLGGWYAATRHQGAPPQQLMTQLILWTTVPAEWCVVLLWWLVYRKRAAFAELFAARPGPRPADFLVGLSLGAAWVAMYGLADVVPFRDMFVFNLAKLQAVPGSLTAGFCEEFLFRGFLFWVIVRAGGNRWVQVIVTSLAFGLAHLMWGPWGMFWTVILGLTLAGVRLWRGSVWPAIIAHALLDLCIQPGLMAQLTAAGSN